MLDIFFKLLPTLELLAKFIVIGYATYYTVATLQYSDGPFGVFVKLRRYVNSELRIMYVADLVRCKICLSFWVAIVYFLTYFALPSEFGPLFLLFLATAGFAVSLYNLFDDPYRKNTSSVGYVVLPDGFRLMLRPSKDSSVVSKEIITNLKHYYPGVETVVSEYTYDGLIVIVMSDSGPDCKELARLYLFS